MNELTRRHFFHKGAQGFGALALSQLAAGICRTLRRR